MEKEDGEREEEGKEREGMGVVEDSRHSIPRTPANTLIFFPWTHSFTPSLPPSLSSSPLPPSSLPLRSLTLLSVDAQVPKEVNLREKACLYEI